MQSAADIKESPDGAMMPEVAQILEKARTEPNNFQAQIRAGEIFLRIQNTERAIEFFNKAAAVRHDSFEDLATLGNAYFDARRFEEAEKWYTAALAKKPDDVNARTDLGSTFMERVPPDLDRAIREYRVSLEKNPKHESTIFNLAVALHKKGDQKGASGLLAQLKQMSPQSPLVVRLEQRIAANSQPGN
jgi:tetratricopeptide (TPR) repeat protein